MTKNNNYNPKKTLQKFKIVWFSRICGEKTYKKS